MEGRKTVIGLALYATARRCKTHVVGVNLASRITLPFLATILLKYILT